MRQLLTISFPDTNARERFVDWAFSTGLKEFILTEEAEKSEGQPIVPIQGFTTKDNVIIHAER
jgi:hypothetical protein